MTCARGTFVWRAEARLKPAQLKHHAECDIDNNKLLAILPHLIASILSISRPGTDI